MKILHKYVLKEHFGPLVFAMTALTSLLLLQYIAKRFGELVGKGLPWSVIGEFLVLSLPLTVALSLPMAVLVATLYAFSRLAAENELTAMKATGVSLRNVLTPVLWAAAGVTIFMVLFNDQVLPRANHRLRSLQGDIAQKKPTFALREQTINEVSPGKLYLRAARLSRVSNVMRGVTIYDMGDATRRRTIYADSGNMAVSPDQADLQLTLYSGTVHEVPVATPEKFQRLYFDTEFIRVRGVGNEFEKSQNDNFKGEREMSVCEMQRNATQARVRFADARKDFVERVALARKRGVKLSQEALATKVNEPFTVGLGSAYCSLLGAVGVKALVAQDHRARADSLLRGGPAGREKDPALSALTADSAARDSVPNEVIPGQVEAARMQVTDAFRSINRYEVEIQKKFALAAACFIFVLLGAPIALRFPRGGVGLTIGVSLVVFGLYYVGLIAGESLARRGHVPPVVSMWIANAVFGIIALILLARMGKESGTPRGGDFREFLEGIRYRMRRRSGRPAIARPGAT
ncbi:MAG: LptF/LptG family permease [Gemmatimonadaceae bacterium]